MCLASSHYGQEVSIPLIYSMELHGGQLHNPSALTSRKEPPVPTGSMLGQHQSRSGCSGVSRNFVQGGSTNSVEDRGHTERDSGGGSLLVRGSGGSCNLIQEISFHIVKFS